MGTEYINLINSGNILFQKWSALIYCQESSKNTLKVNFGVKESNQNVIGVRSSEGSTINSINRTIKFLKKCHAEWLNHLNDKRDKFVEFNHFKTNQISMLRQKLAEFLKPVGFETKIDSELADLLVCLNAKIDYKMLKEANKKAFENPREEESANQPNELETQATEKGDQKALIFQQLKERGFSE